MSASLFKSKQMKSKKNLKKLTISGPLTLEQPGNVKIITSSNPSSPVMPGNIDDDDHVVVLVCKYDFAAESDNELSVKQNQFVKLVHKLGNGWILVCDLDDKSIQGLVPASYLDIAINDAVNPITLEWLREIEEVHRRRINIESINDVVMDQVFQNLKDKNFWYKIQFKVDHEFVYVGKTYHQFYDLHCKLLPRYLGDLPKLPPPVFRTSYYHAQSSKFDKKLIEKLYNLARDLQEYMTKLLETPDILIESTDLYEFVHNCPHVTKTQDTVSSQELISELCPSSIVIEDYRIHNSMTFSATEPLPPPLVTSLLSSLIDKNSRIFRLPDQCVKYSTYINHYNSNKHHTHSDSSNSNSSHSSLSNGFDEASRMQNSETTTEEDEKAALTGTNNTSRSSCNSSLSNSAESSTDTAGTSFDESSKPAEGVSTMAPLEVPPPRPSIASTSSFHQMRIGTRRINSLQSESGDSIFDRHWSALSQPPTPTTPLTLHSENFEKSLNSVISELDEFEFSPDTSKTSPLEVRPRRKSSSVSPITKCHEPIKIKVFLNNKNQDIIALRIKRSNLISLEYLKKLISYKMYNDYSLFQHFSLLVHESEVKLSDDELLQYIKDNLKVKLNLSRTRG
ncbi:hypothetical protein Cantr_05473 [Candida viswanathii]|uniref:Bud emergence protein 1 n=1 Tax=Candida viswanathii TaxID=5486 RepID=A0A367XR61_9ASCO|nr:hypothetical protein Cantr_05473 [Candida viswanathii]